MTPRFVVFFISIFLLAFSLLGIGRCGYKEMDSMRSLKKKEAKIRKEYPDIEHLKSEEVVAALQGTGSQSVLLIDSRTPEEFRVSHLFRAVNLETSDQALKYLGSLKRPPKLIIVYCSVGQRSAALTRKLKEAGIANVKNFVGSIFAWANEDRPLVDSEGKPAEKVHPFNQFWGRLLKKSRRASLK